MTSKTQKVIKALKELWKAREWSCCPDLNPSQHQVGSASQYRPDVQCQAVRLEYDFGKRRGTLRMVADQCCDMSGCITLFLAIDKGVKQIETFSGDRPDTIYVREAASAKGLEGWEAYMQRKEEVCG